VCDFIKIGIWMCQGYSKAGADVISCGAPWRARMVEDENRCKGPTKPKNSSLDSVVY